MKRVESLNRPLQTLPGRPQPLGATIKPDGINFALFSRHASAVTLLLFSETGVPFQEISLDPLFNKTGDIWHILIRTKNNRIQYAYKVDGQGAFSTNSHFFDRRALLLDPYAKALVGGETWGAAPNRRSKNLSGFNRRCLVVDDRFDWQGDRPLNTPLRDTVIYELHVRGFTQHPNSGVRHPGTFSGLTEKIPYLKDLGITAIELMPVADFNETENINRNPETGDPLLNFWGYSPLAFFAPKASYAVDHGFGNQVREFKEMVRAFHKAGIEIILDVVFNHTAEGGLDGPLISFRGIDNTIYYLLDPVNGEYLNFSGCGNTLNCNHPLVRQLIIDCLHYWVVEMHVDGFRFDLASILGRDSNGEVLSNPPMVEMIAEDPILADTKIIAEAWDAGGLYQVGSFSTSARWAEWNGRFRDDIRSFMAGQEGKIPALATRIAGSSDLYQRGQHRPSNSINFVTCHDGFTLYDLVSFNKKNNRMNGEENRDGTDANFSWNSGFEGETDDPSITGLRWRRMKTLATILFLSQGMPMISAGDEFGRTQKGNNNAYCQDNDISWIDWRLAEKNADLLRFFKMLIQVRKEHSVFRRRTFFPTPDQAGNAADILWQSTEPGQPDWSAQNKTLAFLLKGNNSEANNDDDFFIMLNGHRSRAVTITPPPPGRGRWQRLIDTAADSPMDIFAAAEAPTVAPKTKINVQPMSAVVFFSKRTA